VNRPGELDLGRVLCTLAELADPGSRAFALAVGADRGAWPLQGLVVRRGGELRAYVNRCPHAGHPLNLRPHEFLAPGGTLIVCNSHGALFEIATGLCVAGPCAGERLTPVPVAVAGGCVLLAPEVDLAGLAG
jgi:nitrite reductase/ring-hydroxylating ferredoxin subunit